MLIDPKDKLANDNADKHALLMQKQDKLRPKLHCFDDPERAMTKDDARKIKARHNESFTIVCRNQ